MTDCTLMLKRLALAGHDVGALLVISAILSCGFATPAFAYVDPSVMTYTIQALAGVAVALGAVAGVAFRRTRRALMRMLHIDENANKEVEGDVHRIRDGVALAAANEAAATAKAQGRRSSRRGVSHPVLDAYRPKWWQRLILSVIVSAFVVFTLFVVAPYEIISASKGSLAFGLRDLWQPIAMYATALAAAIAVVLTLLRGRAFNAALILTFCFGVCCYVQAMFLNTGLPSADGNAIIWTDYQGPAAVSAVVWLLILVVPLMLSKLNRKAAQGLAAIVSVALVIVQGVGVASLFAELETVPVVDGKTVYTADQYTLTEQGMFTVSPKSNVIVFCLDTYDTNVLLRIQQVAPELFDELTGFTWYQDSVGSMIPTRYGAPFLFTGTFPDPEKEVHDFLVDRHERASFLADMYDANYSIGLYTDTTGTASMPEDRTRELVYDKTININPPEEDQPSVLDERGMIKAMATCALYRDLPWLAKPFCWFYTDEINKGMAVKDESLPPDLTPYTIDDAAWFVKLKNRGLSIDPEADGYAGAYRFIHLLGTHGPYIINAKGEHIEGFSDLETVAQGSLYMVDEYIRMLKELGVYDQSTIIITADHGDWYLTRVPLTVPTSPIMIVKPAYAPDEPMQISKAPISAYDVLPTCMAGIDGTDVEKYGRPVWDYTEGEERDRRYIMTTSTGVRDDKWLEYSITGDVLDMQNWRLTGTEWVFPDSGYGDE